MIIKLGGVAAVVAALGLAACGHHHKAHVEPVVEETVVTEKPVVVEDTTLDCGKVEHKVYKECVGHH